MKVSVVIPAYNEEHYIQKCLESLMAQEVEADEIIVVDNNSTDQTVAIVKQYPPVRIIHESMQGMTPARNAGFNAAKYEIIARTDSDTMVHPDWIKRIKEHFADQSLVALSGPSHFLAISSSIDVERPHNKLFFTMFRRIIGHDCLYGPNMSLRKSAWEKVKNEICMEDKKVHEDIDLALHIAKYGNILFDFNLIVESSGRRFRKLPSYFEYPYRYIRTIQHHKLALDKKTLIKRVKQLSPNQLLKRNKYTKKIIPFIHKTLD